MVALQPHVRRDLHRPGLHQLAGAQVQRGAGGCVTDDVTGLVWDGTAETNAAAGFCSSEGCAGDTRTAWRVDLGTGAVALDTATDPLLKPYASRLVRGGT